AALIVVRMPMSPTVPTTLPVLPLRHGVVLPGRQTTIPVGRPRSRVLAESLASGDLVVLAVQRDPALEDPALVDLHPIATLARVLERTDRGPRGIVLVVETMQRVRLVSLAQSVPYWTARLDGVPETTGDTEALDLAAAL